MIRKLAAHVRSQWIGVLALFVALGGTAYAAATIGSAEIIDNSVASVDLKDGETKTADLAGGAVNANKLAANSVSGAKVADGSISGADVNESTLSVTSSGVVDESLTGQDIQDNTIGGADINESFLPAVSTFATHNPGDFGLPGSGDAQVIWTGDSTGGETGGAFIHLSAPGRVFATATLNFYAPGPTGVTCQLGVIKPGISRTAIGVASEEQEYTSGIENYIPHNFVVQVSAGTQVAAGDYGANVTCSGGATFRSGTLLFWAMPS